MVEAGGVLFAVLAALGAVLLYDEPSDSSPAKLTGWFTSGSHRSQLHFGWLFSGLALLFLIWFVAAVRERVAAHDARVVALDRGRLRDAVRACAVCGARRSARDRVVGS